MPHKQKTPDAGGVGGSKSNPKHDAAEFSTAGAGGKGNLPPSFRRSIRHAQATPDEIGQHCRAAYIGDRLREAVTLAAVAEWLFANECDDDALAAVESFISNAREIAKTARVFRDVHNARGEASHRAAMDHALAVHESEKQMIDEERCAE